MMNILLLSSVTIYGVLSGGLLEEFSDSIGETCDDCYDIALIRPPPRCEPDVAPCTYEFEYEVVFRDSEANGCKSLRQISLGLDNSCGELATDIEAALTFDFGDDYTGNQAPEVTVSEIVVTDADGNDNDIIEISFAFNKKKLKATQTFTLAIDGNEKRSNSDRNLIGFSQKRRKKNKKKKSSSSEKESSSKVATCYTDVTNRLLPEICRPSPSGPSTPPRFPKPDGAGPGNFEYCDVDNNQVCVRGECAALLDGRPDDTTPCDAPADRENDVEGAICVEIRDGRVACTDDDDCEGQDRCYTLIGDVTAGVYDCNEQVCASSNFK